MAKQTRLKFKTIEEKERVLYSHLASEVNDDLPAMTLDEVLDRNESIDFLRSRLEKNHKNAMAHHCMAPLLRTTGDIKSSMRHYQCAVTYNPLDLDGMNDIALMLYKAGSYNRALDILLKVLNDNPDHFLANKNIAAVYVKLGKYRDALRYSRKAAFLQPGDPMVHRNIAKLQNVLGNSLEAVKHNRIAIRLGPGMQAGSEKGDYRAYRAVSFQLMSSGQSGGYEHYNTYRALAGKRNILSLSEKTAELLRKTNTKV